MSETETTTPSTADISKYVSEAVEAIKDEALRAREESRQQTEATVARYDALASELDDKRRRLSEAEVELEALPRQAFTANMDGDAEEEKRLRTKYRQTKDEVPALRSRVEQLEAETASYYDPQRAKREGVRAAVEFKASTRPPSDEPTPRRRLQNLRVALDQLLDDAAYALAPDTAQAVVGARDLAQNREEAARIIRRS